MIFHRPIDKTVFIKTLIADRHKLHTKFRGGRGIKLQEIRIYHIIRVTECNKMSFPVLLDLL